VAALRTPEQLRSHLETSAIPLAFDDALAPASSSPFARPHETGGVTTANRFCVLPMEGWDATADGRPSELTRRRWRRFGASGAKLIWGGEAVAVREDGRGNPHQVLLNDATAGDIESLRRALVDAHVARFGSDRGLRVGLQLTHSGRFAVPLGRPEPLVAWPRPVLDRRFPEGVRVLTDDDLDRLVADFVRAARLAREAGFAFVDVKHCHGYLGHELLHARGRTGRYGGSFENRTRFLREVAAGIRAEAKGLDLAVRFSAFDTGAWTKDAAGVGRRDTAGDDDLIGFGLLEDDLDRSLADARALLGLLEAIDIRWVCVTAGSPYYNPHLQRPALFPPVDGYLPPEDPLRGVARHIEATARLKAAFPRMTFVGSAYSYLQDWLPHVGQRVLREGKADFVGLGRMVLAYPDLPADVLEGRPLQRKALCRTFSDCTTAPRRGLVSGCYPLDPFYAGRPEAEALRRAKEAPRA
jgi:2,4-dienoyl-CoA reductase-like NADH-dependent reductase (Old Yellow Enzyme family)